MPELAILFCINEKWSKFSQLNLVKSYKIENVIVTIKINLNLRGFCIFSLDAFDSFSVAKLDLLA